MNLAADLLRDYLSANKITQGDYAAACGVDQSFVSQVLTGTIAISARNLSKLLEGLKAKEDKLRFLISYLHDQVPTEHVHDLSIRSADASVAPFLVREAHVDPATVFDDAIAQVLGQLPTQTKTQLYQFIQALRVDPALRSVFHGIMRYVPVTGAEAPHMAAPADTAGPFPVSIIKAAQALKSAQALKAGKNMSIRADGTRARSARAPKRDSRASNKK